ncbi:MAG TPA: hypothetical protein VFX59_00220, partial [Polyangiales bacterium]|nr:hypothetical protein [Polyangiales bacterium]
NRVGSELSSVHKYFVGGEPATARRHALAAVELIRAQPPEAEGTLDAELDAARERSVTALQKLAQRLRDAHDVTRDELDQVLIGAHRAELQAEWAHASAEQLQPLLEKPRAFFRAARSRLQANASASTALQLRKGIAYLRLGVQSAGTEERASLDAQLVELNQRAHQAELGELSPTDLQRSLARAEAAYAIAYLHEAATRQQAKQETAARRSLREAAARMRSRLEWLEDDEALRAATLRAEEVERAALTSHRRSVDTRTQELVSRALRSLAPPEPDEV